MTPTRPAVRRGPGGPAGPMAAGGRLRRSSFARCPRTAPPPPGPSCVPASPPSPARSAARGPAGPARPLRRCGAGPAAGAAILGAQPLGQEIAGSRRGPLRCRVRAPTSNHWPSRVHQAANRPRSSRRTYFGKKSSGNSPRLMYARTTSQASWGQLEAQVQVALQLAQPDAGLPLVGRDATDVPDVADMKGPG